MELLPYLWGSSQIINLQLFKNVDLSRLHFWDCPDTRAKDWKLHLLLLFFFFFFGSQNKGSWAQMVFYFSLNYGSNVKTFSFCLIFWLTDESINLILCCLVKSHHAEFSICLAQFFIIIPNPHTYHHHHPRTLVISNCDSLLIVNSKWMNTSLIYHFQ